MSLARWALAFAIRMLAKAVALIVAAPATWAVERLTGLADRVEGRG